MKLKRNVVMLPTNNKANLFHNKINDRLLWDNDSTLHRVLSGGSYQHLYITSDEEIKEGDWYIDDTYDVRQSVTSDAAYWSVRKDYRKIIATTDKSLTISEIVYPEEFVHVLPSPSDGFIKKFIERYNAGNPITEVMVEYDDDKTCTVCGAYQMKENLICQYPNGRDCCGGALAHKLKVDKNNCITTTAVKDSWTRKEVIAFAKKYAERAQATIRPGDKWIEENL